MPKISNSKLANKQLPCSDVSELPDKRYFTIGEISELCDVKPHVLRYWEQEFPQLKPVKRRGNRRYYQRRDFVLIQRIQGLLYEQGYTIGGARQRLALAGNKNTSAARSANKTVVDQKKTALLVTRMVEELEGVLDVLKH
jgi:DNA-binding transcriptional MerR regulator